MRCLQNVASPAVTLNNLETCVEYASQLHQVGGLKVSHPLTSAPISSVKEFERDAAEVFQIKAGGQGDASAGDADAAFERKLQASIAEVAKLSVKSKSILDAGLTKLSTLLKPRLLSLTEKLIGEQSEVNFELTEDDFAENEANDPFAHELLRQFDALLEEYKDGMSDSNFGLLLEQMTGVLTEGLEYHIMDKDFNQLGGVQLDKASRSIDRSPAQPCPP